MKKTFTKMALGAFLVAVPSVAFGAYGLVGDCVDCHTMHNSEQGQPVALRAGDNGTPSSKVPIENLLRMDCISCHVVDPNGADNIVDMGGGSTIPQVAHDANSDLAGGNFAYLADGQRKGHNVQDLAFLYPASIDNGGDYDVPPGMYRQSSTHYHLGRWDGEANGAFDLFTCAGARGCHGTRSQVLQGHTVDVFVPHSGLDENGDVLTDENGAPIYTVDANGFITDENGAQVIFDDSYAQVDAYRVGIAAVSGAHHNSYDGPKTGQSYYEDKAEHDGQKIADGYRFIPGLWGYGNVTSEAARWQNVDASSHNEYFGNTADPGGTFELDGNGDIIDHNGDVITPAANGDYVGAIEVASTCHAEEMVDAKGFYNARAGFTTSLRVPNNSMSGFCATCHGSFHSQGDGDNSYLYAADALGSNNGVSGAFLRHPSDYVIPDAGEYAAATTWTLSAPVARPTVLGAPDGSVTPGTDMVMCLSCHKAHASEYDYMLRFDYTEQQAGNAGAGLGEGCLACHTTKGILPENR
jgi:hypothetical protein